MKQKFAFSRGAEARYKPGFRPYFQDRDLGVKQATGGRFTAEVHRACAPGEFTFSAGDTWIQPPAIRHDVRGFSDDFEVLEIVSPGVFGTHEA